jgi:hypothetical protein
MYQRISITLLGSILIVYMKCIARECATGETDRAGGAAKSFVSIKNHPGTDIAPLWW